MKWSSIQAETKVAILALIFSMLGWGFSEFRYSMQREADQINADIKIKIMEVMTGGKNQSAKSVKFKFNYDELENQVRSYSAGKGKQIKLREEEFKLALYELIRDKLVLYVATDKTYEFSTFTSGDNDLSEDEKYNKSDVATRLAIIEMLRHKKELTKQQVFESYSSANNQTNPPKTKIELAQALYKLIEDEIVVLSANSGVFKLKADKH